jgi:hypothetical protein
MAISGDPRTTSDRDKLTRILHEIAGTTGRRRMERRRPGHRQAADRAGAPRRPVFTDGATCRCSFPGKNKSLKDVMKRAEENTS